MKNLIDAEYEYVKLKKAYANRAYAKAWNYFHKKYPFHKFYKEFMAKQKKPV